MKSCVLHDYLLAVIPAHEQRPPLPEEAAICAEIAARLLELEELQDGLGGDFIFKLSAMFSRSPDGFRSALLMLSGDTDTLTESYEEQAARVETSKQVMHYRHRTAMDRIRDSFPLVSAAVAEVRERITRRELDDDGKQMIARLKTQAAAQCHANN